MAHRDSVLQKARFITFEGGEGAGKTTQIRLLADRLQAAGAGVVVTREPGGCLMAERIRELLVTGQPGDLEMRSELLLILAARIEHIRQRIRPALARGEWVLCDRFSDSTLAYQGYGRGLEREQLEMLNQFALDGLEPERTFLLDIDPAIGLVRAGENRQPIENRFEQEHLAFHQRVRAGFLALAAQHAARIRVIDATLDAQQVASAIWEAM
ncbi:MAG: dTMP kinase [Magnetococcales bacterium]|nr:dTMP kinase [Magnetococcales bacterium]